jgi:hypothetical protein
MSKRKMDMLDEEDELTTVVIHDPFPDVVLTTVSNGTLRHFK